MSPLLVAANNTMAILLSGNTAVNIGNTASSLGNLTLANVTITTINEPSNVTATAANATVNFDVLDNAVQYFTSNAAGNWTVNF
jgi:tRNA C32,U32 (ribose-2'-O)-methylase TrmJ